MLLRVEMIYSLMQISTKSYCSCTSVAPMYKNVPAVRASTAALTNGDDSLLMNRPIVMLSGPTMLKSSSHRMTALREREVFKNATSKATDSAGWCSPTEAAISRAEVRSGASPRAIRFQ